MTPAEVLSPDEQLAQTGRRRGIVACMFGMVAYPSFLVLDRIVYPKHLWRFVAIRLSVCALLAFVIIPGLRRATRSETVQTWLLLSAITCGLGIDLMIWIIGAPETSYYAGLCLVLACTSAFGTFSAKRSAVTALILCSPYIALVLLTLLSQRSADTALIVSNSFFLISIAVATLIGNTIHYRATQKDLASQREMARLNTELDALSRKDALTGLLNRRGLDDRLRELIGIRRRYKTNACLISMDLDNFKSVNDRFGHVAGDDAIRKVAYAILNTIRETDLAYRLGGDEFLVVLPNTASREAEQVARRLRLAFDPIFGATPFSDAGLGVSMGVRELPEGEDVSVEQALSAVDELLYHAKREGKGRIVAFSLTGIAEVSWRSVVS